MIPRLLALAALLLTPALVWAQNLANDAGPFEITVSGAGENDREFENGGFSLAGGVGFFIIPELEIAVRDGVDYTSTKNSGSSWDNTVKGAIDFNLPLDHFEPYIGGNVGYFGSDQFRSSPEAAPEVGLKILFTKNVFVFVQAEYDFYWHSAGVNLDNGTFEYALGLGFRF
jgi:hypothetical protein